MKIDFEKITKLSEERAAQAEAVDQKMRHLLVDEVEKLPIDAEEQMTMAILVALGVANTVLKGALDAMEEHPDLLQATTMATHFFVDSMLGPQLVRLHKLAKKTSH